MKVQFAQGITSPKGVTEETVSAIGNAIYTAVTKVYASVQSLSAVAHVGKGKDKKSYLTNVEVNKGGGGVLRFLSIQEATEAQAKAKNDKNPCKSCVVSI